MRLLPTLFLPVLVTALAVFPALGQAQTTSPAGAFASTFEVVVDNCDGAGKTLSNATVSVKKTGAVLTVTIPGLPDLKGKSGAGAKVRAEAKTEADAMSVRAKFAFNGKAEDGNLKAVLVAEFFKGDKPQCTQSWSVVGKPATK